MHFDNYYQAIAVGPDGAMYLGVYGGLISLKDGNTPVT